MSSEGLGLLLCAIVYLLSMTGSHGHRCGLAQLQGQRELPSWSNGCCDLGSPGSLARAQVSEWPFFCKLRVKDSKYIQVNWSDVCKPAHVAGGLLGSNYAPVFAWRWFENFIIERASRAARTGEGSGYMKSTYPLLHIAVRALLRAWIDGSRVAFVGDISSRSDPHWHLTIDSQY